MTLAADSPSPSDPPLEAQATPRDPADYGRRRSRPGPMAWLLLAFGLACALAGGAFAIFAPRLLGAPPPTAEAPFEAPPTLDVRPVPQATVNPPLTPDGAPSQEVAALRDRLAALEAAQARSAEAAAGALAAAALVEASRGSRPFAEEMAAVDRLLPPTAESRALRRLAETGAPSREALNDDFAAAAARASVAARAPTDGASLIDQAAFALASVISIRRVSVTTGDGPDAVLARAEQRVADGDLDGALTALDALPPKARDAMAAWRGRAERRAAIDRATDAIRAAAMAQLTQARP